MYKLGRNILRTKTKQLIDYFFAKRRGFAHGYYAVPNSKNYLNTHEMNEIKLDMNFSFKITYNMKNINDKQQYLSAYIRLCLFNFLKSSKAFATSLYRQ